MLTSYFYTLWYWEKVIFIVSFPPLCPAAPTTWCDPHHDLRPPGGSTHQRSAVQLQHLPTTTRLPHPWGSHQPQRSAATAGGGWRAGGGGRGGHREHRYRADSRGQQWHREQEAELRRARRDIQQRAGQRGASCCQSGVWGGTHDLLRPNKGDCGILSERAYWKCARVKGKLSFCAWWHADYAMVLNRQSGWSCMSV